MVFCILFEIREHQQYLYLYLYLQTDKVFIFVFKYYKCIWPHVCCEHDTKQLKWYQLLIDTGHLCHGFHTACAYTVHVCGKSGPILRLFYNQESFLEGNSCCLLRSNVTCIFNEHNKTSVTWQINYINKTVSWTNTWDTKTLKATPDGSSFHTSFFIVATMVIPFCSGFYTFPLQWLLLQWNSGSDQDFTPDRLSIVQTR